MKVGSAVGNKVGDGVGNAVVGHAVVGRAVGDAVVGNAVVGAEVGGFVSPRFVGEAVGAAQAQAVSCSGRVGAYMSDSVTHRQRGEIGATMCAHRCKAQMLTQRPRTVFCRHQ